MASAQASDPLWAWGEEAERPRILHTMIRIRDAETSLRFYRDGLGMNVLDRYDFEQGRFSIIFLSYAGYREGPAALELTYNWDRSDDYSHGSGYGHVAIGVPDVRAMYDRLPAYGGRQISAPKSMVPGAPQLAFIQDPDGYAIELIQIRRSAL